MNDARKQACEIIPPRFQSSDSPLRPAGRLAFIGGDSRAERNMIDQLSPGCEIVSPEQADVIVVLGGNGAVIRALHRFHMSSKPIYPLGVGYKSFLTNEPRPGSLPERIGNARSVTLVPLLVDWIGVDGRRGQAFGFNEVALFRQSQRMTHIRIVVDGRVRLAELSGDGVLVSTPAGSTAYNLSAQGPILPLDARLLALTPIAPFRPRRWRGALLPDQSLLHFQVMQPGLRSTNVSADFVEVSGVTDAMVRLDHDRKATVLLDADHSLDERILREQFKI